ncbi:formimidoylglutamase [Vibrio methylphosphonaticus]|uniref:formimidoylglutamase n=1 Tax=Vibrio methylphosphonaticus TaxID=2946866 RepID=UPI00202A2FDC|nr:formimidoylglutamase [Vibrio methylphosphonaticus]MCL9773701.1 formimidoylglutamase [Vibrio methylphosphonaticus]
MSNDRAKTNHRFHWQGRDDQEDGEKRYRLHHVVKSVETLTALANPAPGTPPSIALLGFETDEGVQRNKGRIGASQAPDRIRQALCNLAWHEASTLYDLGNVTTNVSTTSKALEENQALTAEIISRELDHAPLIVLGGGHEIAWSSFLGLAQNLTKHDKTPRIGIINFDAHFDLREYRSRTDSQTLQPSSGTPFSQIADYCQSHQLAFNYLCIGVSKASNTKALFERAEQLNVHTLLDEDMLFEVTPPHLQALEQFMDNVDHLYLTIDLDVFSAAHAPGVSAPAALGLSPEIFYPYFKTILKHKDKLRLADVAEYNPNFDIDGRTAKLAARLVWQIMTALSETK